MKQYENTKEFEMFIDYFKYYILSSDHFKQYIKSNVITLNYKNLNTKELKIKLKTQIKERELKENDKQLEYLNKNSSFNSKRSNKSDDSFVVIENSKLIKKINNSFNSLNEDLDYIEFNKEECIKKSNLIPYFEVVNDLIDSLFVLKGIFLENNNIEELLNISNVLKNVVCKLIMLVLESLILSKLKNT